MDIPLIRYSLDPTGQNPDNLIENEEHTLLAIPLRPLILTYGAFFKEHLQITDIRANRILVDGVDYECGDMVGVATELYGYEINYSILIINEAVSNEVRVTYQALGGCYSKYNGDLLNIYNTVLADPDKLVYWKDIILKPGQFNPSPHKHNAREDLIGLEYLVWALGRLTDAISLNSTSSLDGLYSQLKAHQALVNTLLETTNADLYYHIGDRANPHRTDKIQTELGEVANLRPSTRADIEALVALPESEPSTSLSVAHHAAVTTRELLDFRNITLAPISKSLIDLQKKMAEISTAQDDIVGRLQRLEQVVR